MDGISVIVSYHNEAKTLRITLDLLISQTLLPKEIILINSSSTDDSSKVIQQWIERHSAKHDVAIHNIDEGTNVPGSSMNVGIRNASCDLLAFMDCGLFFDKYWLQRQLEYLHANKSDVVSGCCRFEGVTLLDKSTIAQTYGYQRLRPTVPSSIVRKVVFEKTGLFLENRRAGHDVDWVNKLKRENVRRDINRRIQIKYFGVNYAKSLKDIFLKTIKYSENSVGLYKYYNQHIYGIFIVVIAVLYSIKVGFFRPWPYNDYIPLAHIDKLWQYFDVKAGLVVCLIYVILRGYIIPIFKSQDIRLLHEQPLAILTLPLVGFIMDIGKLIGYVKGHLHLFFKKMSHGLFR